MTASKMGRKPKAVKASKIVPVYFTPEQHRMVKEKAQLAGLPISVFLKQCAEKTPGGRAIDE